ncbi:SepM family pheromone-processing serine protease [Streptococcus pacificus]|uniref:endopeptidase La n=1 Tax=Streptococcus pacificus TaxID=2740577 RepID=A0ABS0ZIS0_9STRE|nr:PDZ domain-containing protein [Streptococcus pacificus]
MKTIKEFKWWLISIFTVLFIIGAFAIPLPYYMETPGGAYDIRSVLTVNETDDNEEGSYNFVAVTVSRASLAQIVYSWFSPFADITTIEETTGGYSQEDYWRINQFYMETSQNSAIYQALKLAGKEAKLDYQGVYVLSVSEDSTFKNTLNLADTVTGVNGKTFQSSKDLIDYVGGLNIGDDVTVQYTSNGNDESATGKIIKLENGKNGIGIGLVDHTEVNTQIPVNFNTEGVGGPSAGLMFTLDIYDQLIDEDLRKGRIIAGTGTIEQDGSVGDIGGIDKKVVSADEIGASIFFAPNNPVSEEFKKINPEAKTNYEEALEAAKALKTDMKIVPVKTVEEAIAYLREH